jgi:hypothetical protein
MFIPRQIMWVRLLIKIRPPIVSNLMRRRSLVQPTKRILRRFHCKNKQPFGKRLSQKVEPKNNLLGKG